MIFHLFGVPAAANPEDHPTVGGLVELVTPLAKTLGSRSITRQIPVATLRFLVADAAIVIATKGSIVCEYSRGSSPPSG
jgi:hypothetical protein